MFQSFIAAQRRFWWDFTISEPCCSTAFGVKFNTRFSFYLSCKYPWMEWMKTYIVLTLMNLLEVGWCNETCKVILQCQWQFSLIHVFLWRNLVWLTSFLWPKLEGFVTYHISFPDLAPFSFEHSLLRQTRWSLYQRGGNYKLSAERPRWLTAFLSSLQREST